MKKLLHPLITAAAFLTVLLISNPAQALSKKDAEEAGAVLFRDKGCTYCHGVAAQGTPKGPSLADVHKTMKPAQIAHQIENGGQRMPSFADSLSKDEVAQLVAYLRAKHRPVPATTPAAPQTSAPVSNPGQ